MEELSLRRLDEISLALFASSAYSAPAAQPHQLTPFFEWYWLKSSGHKLDELVAQGRLSQLQAELRKRHSFWIAPAALGAGFLRIRRDHTDVENIAWVSFRLAFNRAVRQAGFAKSVADQLTGVLQEMEDNIHCHSNRSRSGIVAYLTHPSVFEFVVMDRGQGVLASLRQAPEFSGLSDHGTALQLAIATGNSRFGTGVGRGWGFSEITLGIANQNALVRFRSGDHLLELDGTRNAMKSRSAQRASGNGLLVAVQVHR